MGVGGAAEHLAAVLLANGVSGTPEGRGCRFLINSFVKEAQLEP